MSGSSLVCIGRNIVRVDVVHDQLLADVRRRDDATDSDQPLESGTQVWGIGKCLLHDSET